MLLPLVTAIRLSGPTPEDFDLAWDASDACPDEPAVRRELRALVGDPAATESFDGLEIRGAARAVEGGFEVQLTLRDPGRGAQEARRFEDTSCTTATTMAVMLAAVAIRTQRAESSTTDQAGTPEREADDEVDDGADDEVEPLRSPERPVVPPTEPRQRSAPMLEGSVGLLADPTSVGAFSAGPRLGVAVRWDHAAVRLDGTYLVPRSIAWADRAGAGISLGTAALMGCWVHERSRWGVDACGGVELGAIRAAGFGVPDARVDHAAWVAGIASAAPRLIVSPRVRLSLDGQLLVPIARPRVRFATPRRPIHRVGVVGARFGASLHVRFAFSKRSEPS